MTRKIKFRGKRVDNGEWVYGGLVEGTQIVTSVEEYACSINGKWIASMDDLEIDPATVGQFIGLQDKNGVDIFEGDRVSKCSYEDWKKGKRPWDEPLVIGWDESKCKFSRILKDGAFDIWDLWDTSGYEVVGNIFDEDSTKEKRNERK